MEKQCFESNAHYFKGCLELYFWCHDFVCIAGRMCLGQAVPNGFVKSTFVNHDIQVSCNAGHSTIYKARCTENGWKATNLNIEISGYSLQEVTGCFSKLSMQSFTRITGLLHWIGIVEGWWLVANSSTKQDRLCFVFVSFKQKSKLPCLCPKRTHDGG